MATWVVRSCRFAHPENLRSVARIRDLLTSIMDEWMCVTVYETENVIGSAKCKSCQLERSNSSL